MADESARRHARKTVKKSTAHPSTHKLVKRPAPKREQAANVVYVTGNSNFKQLFERCSTLCYDATVREIVIYSLGAAIKRGILLALQVTEKHYLFGIHAQTYTTALTDDLEPATDDADYAIQKRNNSALRIVLKRGSA